MGTLGFYIFNHFIAYYGLMIVIGILFGSVIALIQIHRYNLKMNNLITICSISGLCGILSAKILYLIVSFKEINLSRITDLSYLTTLMSGGFVFLGGVIGIIPALWFCKFKFHISIQTYLQACIGCFPIGHAFGRIGCFIVGCCYGIPYQSSFSVVYKHSVFAPNNIELFPVQLVEALCEFLIGIFLLINSKRLKDELGFLLYLILYSLCRFFLEFLRYDEIRGKVFGISTSQLLCILFFLISLMIFIWKIKKFSFQNA